MKQDYMACLARVLITEGGYVNNPKDPGGPTNLGITSRTLAAYCTTHGLPQKHVKDLGTPTRPDPIVVDIYRREYWDRVKGDDLPAGVDYITFSAAVNCGPSQATKFLQKSMPGVGVDGVMGPGTLAAVRADSDNDVLCAHAIANQIKFKRALRTWNTFGKGWTTRANHELQVAQAMASGSVGPAPVYVADVGKARLADAKTAAHTASADATAGGGISIVAATQYVHSATDQLQQFAGLPHLDHVLFALTSAGIVLTGVGGLFSWYQRRRRDELADALMTKPVTSAGTAPVPVEADDQEAQPA